MHGRVVPPLRYMLVTDYTYTTLSVSNIGPPNSHTRVLFGAGGKNCSLSSRPFRASSVTKRMRALGEINERTYFSRREGNKKAKITLRDMYSDTHLFSGKKSFLEDFQLFSSSSRQSKKRHEVFIFLSLSFSLCYASSPLGMNVLRYMCVCAPPLTLGM